ncbi:MAG: hypothetical protein V4695_01375 [Pseudomonadota bacterium]
MTTSHVSAGYVPGAADADGSEDPAPAVAIQDTGVVSAEKTRIDKKTKPTFEGKNLKSESIEFDKE